MTIFQCLFIIQIQIEIIVRSITLSLQPTAMLLNIGLTHSVTYFIDFMRSCEYFSFHTANKPIHRH